MKNEELKIRFGLQPAKRPHEQPRAAGLRRREAAARRRLRRRNLPEASPQPSGRACDQKEQPSARGRLRAANRYAIEFAGNHLNQTRRAAARRCPTASPRPCKKYGPGDDPNGQKPAADSAGFFFGIVFDLFPDSCGSATAVRFLHLFKFGLVVLEGAIPSGAAGSREDSLLFFCAPNRPTPLCHSATLRDRPPAPEAAAKQPQNSRKKPPCKKQPCKPPPPKNQRAPGKHPGARRSLFRLRSDYRRKTPV